MTRIRFEDLPSTNTPRNAENLNKLNNVVISPTEPTTGEEVWIQKGKNLFNKNNYNIFNGYINDSTLKWVTNASGNFIYLKVKPNTTYTISREIVAEQFAVATGVNTPINDGSVTSFIDGTGKTFVTITTGENDNYLYIYVLWTSSTSPTLSNVLNSLQVEEGETATEYELYVGNKIYTKNANDKYEKFYNEEEYNKDIYSTGEQRIGTWIDDKPLYRQVINVGTVTKTELSIGNIPNLKYIVSCIGVAKWGAVLLNLPNTWGNTNGDIALSHEKLTEMTDIAVIVEYTKTTD